MGDINQKIILAKLLQRVDGAILEIGSKNYVPDLKEKTGITASFRDMYAGVPYVGLDIEEGAGVDKVLDLEASTGDLPLAAFGLIVCCSVLEHVRRPWVMAEHIASLLRPGGHAFISVPWVHRYHGYPDDYYRFSHNGVKALFPMLSWSEPFYSTTVRGEILPWNITEEKGGTDNQLAVNQLLEPGRKRKYLPYLMVSMLGTKPA
jgi:SAM-dependent methyltransferase